MESTDLRMDELFETDAIDDDDLGAMAPMPDLDGDEGPMRQEGNDEEGEVNEDVLNKLKDLKGASKKRVMRPQPKLDTDRLRTKRGLPELSGMFENTKFKGRGHEADDLRLMMGKLEHWAHRLFPKMTFDEFVERLERLGQKKAVQTCVRKIRLGMPLLDDEIVEQAEGGNEEQGEEEEFDRPVEEDIDAEEAFEEMMRKEREDRAREENMNGGNDQATNPSGGNAVNQNGMDEQTEAEILAALDSDDEWEKEVIESTQKSQSSQKNNSTEDELNLRLTASENTEADSAQSSQKSTAEETTEPSLDLHLTPSEEKQAQSPSDKDSQNTDKDSQNTDKDSQNTDIDLRLTESEDVNNDSQSTKSNSQNSQSQENCQDSQNTDIDLHLTESEDINNDSQSNSQNSQSQENGQDLDKSSQISSQKSNSNSKDDADNDDSEDDLNLKLTETEKHGKTESNTDPSDIAAKQTDSNDKVKKPSSSEEQEGGELILNLSTSDSEMTADES